MHKFKYFKYYFISECDTNLIKYQSKFTNIIYRNYKKEIDVKKILKLKNFCKRRGNKLFISNNIKLAINLGLDGVYLPSFNKSYRHLFYTFKKKFEIIGSAHSIKEIKIKQHQGAKFIFLSSLFKKNKNFLGLNKFKIIENFCQCKIIALGGISMLNIKKLNLTNVRGFAGISFFKNKKKAPKKGPFNILDSK